jgi:hypothetical protein
MCIIIDTNALASVFNNQNALYHEFEPVYNWIYNGKGKIVYGGSKYKEELAKTKYMSVFLQFRIAGKAVAINDEHVNRETERVSEIIVNRLFNDQHLVGLALVSGCILICSQDRKSFSFLTNPIFYPPPKERPRIYSGRRNRNLLDDQHIVDVCRPCAKTSNAQKLIIGGN